jgi:hypothetical protein
VGSREVERDRLLYFHVVPGLFILHGVSRSISRSKVELLDCKLMASVPAEV